MAKTTGRVVPVGLARQTTRGVIASAPTKVIPRTDFSFTDTPESVTNESSINVLDETFDKQNTVFVAEGDIAGNLNMTDIGNILYAFFGAPNTIGTDPNYTHIFELKQNSLPEQYTVFTRDGAGTLAWKNGVLTALEFSFSLGEYVSWSSSWMASKSAPSSNFTPAYTSDIQYPVQRHVSATYGGTAVKIRSASLSFGKPVEQDIVLGVDTPDDFLTTMSTFGGSLSFYVDTAVFRTEMLGNTKKDTEITVAISSTKSLKFTIKNCHIDSYSPDYSINSIVEATVDFTGTYDIASGYTVRAELKNQVASHAR